MAATPTPYPSTTPLGSGVERAIAFGGGGEWFVAWCLGYIKTLKDNGVELSNVDLTVGTSAGSATSALLTAGVIDKAFEQWSQLAENPEMLSSAVKVDSPSPSRLRALAAISNATNTEPETIREIGRAAMAAKNQPEAEYLAAATQIMGGMTAWPSPAFHTTAVDCFTGERLIVDQNSGVTLASAVGASASLPGTGGPTWVGDSLCMDGGVSKSSTHADILVGAKRVIIFTLMNLTPEEVALLPRGPFGLAEKTHPGNANKEAAMIEAAGGKAFVVAGNPPAGTNFMDATLLKDAMSRGVAQALIEFPAIKAVWND